MTVLITGAGLIGCHTAALLAARGDDVILLDLHPEPPRVATLVPLDRVRLLQGDVTERRAIRDLIDRHRVRKVIHTAAALSTAIRARPVLAADVNLGGTVNLLEACRELGVERCVLASSTTVAYSTFSRLRGPAQPEDFDLRVVSERPGSLYAASKLACEFFALHYAQAFGLSVAVLRYAAVLGLWAGPNNSVPGRLMQQLLGHGARQGRVCIEDPLLMWSGGEDFIDARDVAAANRDAIDAPSCPSVVYTIASGTLSRFDDFLQAARRVRPDLEITHAPVPAVGFAGFAHARDVPFDVSLARAELGFSAQHDIESSLHAARPLVTG